MWARWRLAAGRRWPAEVESAARAPAIEGLAGAGAPISSRHFSVEVRGRAGGRRGGVNDISGGGEEMFELVADSGLRLRADAHRGPAAGRRQAPELRRRGRAPQVLVRGESRAGPRLGVGEEQIAIDPGLDFDLSPEQDLEILRRLGELRALGLPLYVSLSRKDFIGAVLAGAGRRLPAASASGGRCRGGAGGARGRRHPPHPRPQHAAGECGWLGGSQWP
jgi:dihydropteroate synthase